MLYVYALLDRPPPRKLGRGILDAPVRGVGKHSPFAIVSSVAGAPDPDAAGLRAHDRVVRRAAATRAAILPARFGCVVEHDEELLRLLRTRRSELSAALDRVRGREQMILRFFQRVPEELARSGGRGRGGAGTRYLERRLAAARRTRAVLKPVLAAVAGLVKSEHIELADAVPGDGSPQLLASVYHLVPRGAARAYAAAVTRGLHGSKGLRTWLSGPCPPYAFAAEPLP